MRGFDWEKVSVKVADPTQIYLSALSSVLQGGLVRHKKVRQQFLLPDLPVQNRLGWVKMCGAATPGVSLWS